MKASMVSLGSSMLLILSLPSSFCDDTSDRKGHSFWKAGPSETTSGPGGRGLAGGMAGSLAGGQGDGRGEVQAELKVDLPLIRIADGETEEPRCGLGPWQAMEELGVAA